MSFKTISRAILLVILGLVVVSFFWAAQNDEGDPVVREYYDCIEAVCRKLDGAGDVCAVQKPRMTKITITDNDGVKTITFSTTTDRCENGSR